MVPAGEMSPPMGWQPPTVEVVTPQQPPVYIAQHPGKVKETRQTSEELLKVKFVNWFVVANVIMQNQSRIGLYPVKLQPCPHCQIECKTTIKQEATLRTHLLALILCATW